MQAISFAYSCDSHLDAESRQTHAYSFFCAMQEGITPPPIRNHSLIITAKACRNGNTPGTGGSALSLDNFTLCGADLTDELRFGGFSFRLRQQ